MSATRTTESLRPVHDRVTLVSYATLASWSWFVYGFGASLALLRDEQGSSPTLSGLHGTSLAIGGVIGALLAARLNNRFGRGVVLRVAVIGAAAFCLLFLLPGSTIGWTLATAFIACFFANICVVGVNSFIATHQGDASPGAFTESTALAALMGLLAPLTVGALAATVIGWRGGLVVAVIGFVAVEIARGRRVSDYGTPGHVATRRTSGGLPRLTYTALVAGMCYLGAEFCLSLWGVDLLRSQAGLSPAAAAAGLGCLTGGLFIGRVIGSRMTDRLPTERLLQGSIVAGLACFFMVWTLSSPTFVLIAFFCTGVGLSMEWPLSVARILRSSGGRTDRASGATLAFGTAAIAIAPFVLGALTERIDIHQAFLIVPALLALSLAIVTVFPVPEAVATPK